MWKNIVELNRPQMTIWHMVIAYWTTKATDIHTHNILYLSLFHCKNPFTNVPHCYFYMYIDCLVITHNSFLAVHKIFDIIPKLVAW